MQNISIIGSEKSLCINSDGCYGVLYVGSNKRVICATCRFGKTNCVHVKHLCDICNESKSDLSETLQQYAQLLSVIPSVSSQKYPDYSCLSKQSIPFELPCHLSSVLRCQLKTVSTWPQVFMNLCHVTPPLRVHIASNVLGVIHVSLSM